MHSGGEVLAVVDKPVNPEKMLGQPASGDIVL